LHPATGKEDRHCSILYAAGCACDEGIPAFVEMAKKEHPDIHIMTTDFVGSHPLMEKIVEDLVEKTK
jgi:hypothetical protein